MTKEIGTFLRSFQLKDILEKKEELETLLQKEGVRLAYLYGSLLQRKESRDADIAVLFKTYSFDVYQHLLHELCRLFHVDNIDLLPLNRAPFPMKIRIVLSGMPLYEDDPQESLKLSEEVLTELEDHQYFSRMARVELDKRVKGGLTMAARELDKERVRNYLSRLDEMVGRLVTLKKSFASLEDFRDKVNLRELSVHYLRIALECVLDICRHFLAVKGVSLAEAETTNLIELAGEKGLLPPDFARKIKGMAGMRNAIVHVYWNLDYDAIYEVLIHRLHDFDDFARYVLQHLERQDRC